MSHGSTFDKKDPANDFTMTTNSKGILSVGPDESHLQSATIAIALKLDNVKKVFEPRSASAKKIVVKALDGVSFEVRVGEFVSIVGPSGSGKSTLLNVIGALDRPTSGKVFIKGQDIFLLDDARLSDSQKPTDWIHFPIIQSYKQNVCPRKCRVSSSLLKKILFFLLR